MRIRTRIFLGIFAIFAVAVYFLVDWLGNDLTRQYRESTEEPLVDTARILASIAAQSVRDDEIDVFLFQQSFNDVYSRPFEAQIYNFLKTDVDFRVYITDRQGIVIFDSDSGRDEGEDYSEWHDVSRTLLGEYGARTSRDLPDNPNQSVMYVAAPIVLNSDIIGVLSVGKPTRAANLFIEASNRKIATAGILTVLAVVILGLILSGMITRPIQQLTNYARSVRDGKRVPLPPLGSGEVEELGQAFEQMRDALEGKQYVERYVQTLTHEIKSPLAGIQGACELLSEDPPLDRRMQFFANIQSESKRIETLIEKLLLLSSLESKKELTERQDCDLADIAREVRASVLAQAQARDVAIGLSSPEDLPIHADAFLLTLALTNLLKNAIEHSPAKSTVELTISKADKHALLCIRDSGPGIPQYAQDRIFERFYSLSREGGKKGTGLGLSLVREVCQLHQGEISIESSEEGVRATMKIPLRSTN